MDSSSSERKGSMSNYNNENIYNLILLEKVFNFIIVKYQWHSM